MTHLTTSHWLYAYIIPAVCALVFGLLLLRKSSRDWLEDRFTKNLVPFDVLTGVALTALLFCWLTFSGLMDFAIKFLSSDGTAVYGALLGAFAALLGFAVAVLAIVCTVIPSVRLAKFVSKNDYEAFWKTFTLLIRMLGICTFASLLAIFLNKSTHIREGVFLFVAGFVAITLPGMVRAAATLEVLVKALGAPLSSGKRRENKPVVP